MNYQSLIGVFLFLSSMLTYAQKPILIDEIVGVVGDKIILKSDILVQTLQAEASGMTGEDIPCRVMEQMLLEKMFLNQALVDSIEISEEEVEGELNSRLQYFINMIGSEEKLEAYYKKSLIELKEDFRQNVKDQLLARRMQRQVFSSVTVTPAEVKELFESIPADSIPYFNAEVELGHLVVIPKVTREQKQVVKKQLEEIKRKIESEERTFEDMAKAYSEDPGSAANGGNLGWTSRGQFVPEFEGAAFKLESGTLSEIVESQFGFHLIKMLERRGDKFNAQHILIKPQTSEAEETKATAFLDSIRQLILTDSLEFKLAVEEFSEDEISQKSGGIIANPKTGSASFEMDELDPDLYFTIDTLQKGQLSQPVEYMLKDGTKAYRILYVYNRTKPHEANLKDDYSKIQKFVQAKKENEATMKFLQQNVPKTYIHIDPEYHSCPTAETWLKDKN